MRSRKPNGEGEDKINKPEYEKMVVEFGPPGCVVTWPDEYGGRPSVEMPADTSPSRLPIQACRKAGRIFGMQNGKPYVYKDAIGQTERADEPVDE